MTALLPCPHCRDLTDSLKSYRVPTLVVFILVAASWRAGQVVGCPSCTRKELLKLAAINVLPANILWLVLLLPWYSIVALLTMTRGHSASLERALSRR